MKKARILLALGIWVAILPYLGFPPSWKTILFTITGFGIMALSYIFYKEYKNNNKTPEKKVFDNFLENKDFIEEKINSEENNAF